ncbi:Arginine deiminase [Pelomyxa schiedti]|nr:Arginine deiminase [Pelomyxa schiedti]
MGSLHPAGSLYERPVDLKLATEQHAALRAALEKNGVKVHEVHQVLIQDADKSFGARLALEELAAHCLIYVKAPPSASHSPSSCAPCTSAVNVVEADVDHYVSDTYKRQVLEGMAPSQLAAIVLTRPTVVVEPSFRDTGVTATYTFKPLTNITFTRDQQITTCSGIVMGRLMSEQRMAEVDIMEFCLRKLGFHISGRVPPPGHLEGGDFFPAGNELCFIGIGLRSDMHAVKYLLDQNLLGTRSVAVVEDRFEQHQYRMHLDCVFNIIGPKLCVMLEDMIGETSTTKRLVHEYSRETDDSPYRLVQENVEFSTYLKSKNYTIIPISGQSQLSYGCNMLNLGDGRIISVHSPTARKIAAHPAFQGDISHVDISQITACYGAVHCATQVVLRD